jgi:transcriptional regulator with PAS, ATPase and Fis domain
MANALPLSVLDQLGQPTAQFDKDFRLLAQNKSFMDLANTPLIKGSTTLFDAIDEYFGLESVLRDFFLKHSTPYTLAHVQRADTKRSYHFNLIKHREIFIFIARDITSETQLAYAATREKNRIRLLFELVRNQDLDSENQLLGKSPAIDKARQFAKTISRIAETNILLVGETGTGKSHMARYIHALSPQKDQPLIEFNCAAIPENLLESELFGHVKGAYTGAINNKKGLIEEANGGTLFLDEIGELPLLLQGKLLSVIEKRTFRPVGSNQVKKVRLRIITATNKDLKESVALKEFREDLYFRLNVVQFKMPALRDSDNDVLLIANHFLAKNNLTFNKNIHSLSPEASHKMLSYHWPGNIRELRNTIERAMIFCENTVIDASNIQFDHDEDSFALPKGNMPLPDIEKNVIIDALARTEGNKTRAALLLGISRDTLRYRIQKYKL